MTAFTYTEVRTPNGRPGGMLTTLPMVDGDMNGASVPRTGDPGLSKIMEKTHTESQAPHEIVHILCKKCPNLISIAVLS